MFNSCQAAQGNCIKLGQTHVRLPESGRGAPCGRPSQGITSRTVQIVVRYRKFSTSLATGGRFLGRKKKTIGRGAPCGRPSQGITSRTVQTVVRYRKFSTSLATGGRFLGRKKKTIGRGAPCGCPSSAILASELRCVCPASCPRRGSVPGWPRVSDQSLLRYNGTGSAGYPARCL